MSNIEYFIGKICTIFTQQINRNFKDENPKTYPKPVFDYFMGVIEAVDQNGVLIRQINGPQKSYFYHQSIVAICEEEVLDPNNKEDAETIAALKNRHEKEVHRFEKEIEEAKKLSGPLDPDQLARKAQQMKESFGK